MEKVFTRSIVLLRTALKKYSSEKNVIFRNPLRTVTSSITQTSHQQRSNSELGKKLGTDCNSQFVIPHYLYGTNMDVLSIIARDMTVLEDFISEKEEVSFLEELEPYMKRLRYEFNHWDDVRALEYIK